MYGNYDGKRRAPTFDLYLGANLWTTVLAWDSWTQLNLEIIHISPSDHINVCLVNTGNGIPFISALELRPIGNEIYLSEAGTSLQLSGRFQFSSTAKYQLTRLVPGSNSSPSVHIWKKKSVLVEIIFRLPLTVGTMMMSLIVCGQLLRQKHL